MTTGMTAGMTTGATTGMTAITITLSLVSHTNVGKTTLARTLLGRDIGEVRDAPHVTEFADEHLLLESPAGHRLVLWDTPGFGDSVRLARRMRQQGNPLGWLISQAWDRWRDRPFWASQQALRHVKSGSDVLLYLVNASEPDAGYLASEMQLLAWVGTPVLVLLNQTGVPRSAAEEEAELAQWRERLAPWPLVREVLPLDAFARCWVHEEVLLRSLVRVLAGDPHRTAALTDDARAAAMAELASAWRREREAQFEQSLAELSASLVRTATARELLPEPVGLGGRLRELGTRWLAPSADDPAAAAQQRLAVALETEVRASTSRLLEMHGLQGNPSRGSRGSRGRSGEASGEPSVDPVAQILARVATQVEQHRRLPEGRAAVLGGALTGALAGLKADIATGGLTLGGGLLAGGILGALGAAGLARGINVLRGTSQSWVTWGQPALHEITEAALLRYLAVAHFGRGRGDWVEGESPPHWPAAVQAALSARRAAFEALWSSRSERAEAAPDEAERLAAALQPLLAATLRQAFATLYPTSDNRGTP